MKGLLSIRLAWSGIRKNRKLYLPYCLTIIGMVMMSYIMQALSYAPALHAMKGGSNLEAILSLGKLVIAVFAGDFSAVYQFLPHSPPLSGVRPIQCAGHGQKRPE